MGSGKYSDVFKVSDGKRSVVMKLSYYRDDTLCAFASKLKKGDAEGARAVKNRDSIMVSSAFADATNSLIAKKASPHFVFVYCNADCRNLAPRLKTLLAERFKTATKVQVKYNNACFMELFTCDMTKWLRGKSRTVTDDVLRKALFGVLYTLAVLQKTYPGFRHNDLSTNNVLIKKLRKPASWGYSIDGHTYVVDDMPVLVAINDYDFTHVPNHPTLANERIINGKYSVTATRNRTYDTHFFLKSVLKSISKKKTLVATRDFIQSLPLRSQDRLDKTEIRGLEPDALLRHQYFDPIRKKIPKAVTEVFTC